MPFKLNFGIRSGEVFQRSKIAGVRQLLEQSFDAYTVVPITNVDKEAHRINIVFEIEWRWPWDAQRFWLASLR